jgi:two-component system sensor histidine kinase KdpD
LKLQRDWIGLDEIVASATTRLRKLHPRVIVNSNLPADPPLLYVHAALIEQALFNILENAATFSPADAPVSIAARLDGRNWIIDIVDRGPGIPENERQRVFDPFYSVARGDRGAQGTGLGLVICQGMIGAHGGRVEALAGPSGIGTLIRVTLPASEIPQSPAQDQGAEA